MSSIEITFVILIICFGFYIQTVAGFAAALFAVPLLLFITDLPTALAIMSILLLLWSLILLVQEWKNIDKKVVSHLAIPVIIGMVLGVITLRYANPYLLKKALGIFILAYVFHALRTKKHGGILGRYTTFFGLLGGYFSGLFATGGPFYVIHISNRLKEVSKIRATIIGILVVTNSCRIVLFSGYKMLTLDILKIALLTSPFFLLSIYLGQKTFYSLKEKDFSKIILLLLGISGFVTILS